MESNPNEKMVKRTGYFYLAKENSCRTYNMKLGAGERKRVKLKTRRNRRNPKKVLLIGQS